MTKDDNNGVKIMPIRRIVPAGIAHPFGDTRQVTQAMGPMVDGVTAEDTDPFLMCDYFDSTEMDDLAKNDDDFPIGWHPHRGFDIATYLVKGKGRHADSLGNRTTFQSPGMQWMSTGSGVYHAEGGANPKGERMQGHQIWINVPSDQKLDEPRYGTVQPQDLPLVQLSNVCRARVLAGECLGARGPFLTVQPVQILDIEITARSTPDEVENSSEKDTGEIGTTTTLDISQEFDTVILFVYQGSLQSINDDSPDNDVPQGSVFLLDATDKDKRRIALRSSSSSSLGSSPVSIMLFAGQRLNQPIAWQGPIVMTDEYEIANTFSEMRGGFFPPVCVDWDDRTIASKPAEEEEVKEGEKRSE